MAKKVKITQRELKNPDKFREAISNTVVFISDNYKTLLLALTGVIVILIAAFVIISLFERQKMEASTRFKKAFDSYSNGKSEEALGELLAIRNEYPDAEIAKIALYYAATINYDTGKYDESTRLMSEFLRSDVKDQTLRDAAYLTLGLSSFNQGKWQEAFDNLSKVDKMGSPYEEQAKLHIGLSLEKQARYSEAEKIYKEILSKQSRGAQDLTVE
jgi:hypothetical protein